jgi:hypothetical protein
VGSNVGFTDAGAAVVAALFAVGNGGKPVADAAFAAAAALIGVVTVEIGRDPGAGAVADDPSNKALLPVPVPVPCKVVIRSLEVEEPDDGRLNIGAIEPDAATINGDADSCRIGADADADVDCADKPPKMVSPSSNTLPTAVEPGDIGL